MKHKKLLLFFVVLIVSQQAVGQWLCPWEGRQRMVVKENSGTTLTDYQVKLKVPFVTGMNTDYSDLRFTSNDGVTQLSFFLENYNSSFAIIWLKIPELPANSAEEYFLYYCNKDANSVSNPDNTFLFYDDFDSVTGWSDYGSGTVVADNSTFPGVTTLKKNGNCDPNGGYKLLGQTVNSFRFISREQRRNEGANCSLDRYGIEDSSFDGYNIRRSATTTGNGAFGFERRNNGSGGGYQSTTLSQPRDNWYRTELTRCYEDEANLDDDVTSANLYNDNNDLIGGVTGSDDNYTSFDRVTVRGGYPYFMDFIAVGKFTCNEPKVSFKKTELDIPVISCKDITVSVDEDGLFTLDPEMMIESVEDCNTLEYVANQTEFSCDNLGTQKIKILASDPCGNETDCRPRLTIIDDIKPTISCPDDITIEANQADCKAKVVWDEPSYKDNCEVESVNSSHASGSIFDMGKTEVKYVVTDPSGNENKCSFFVTVISSAANPSLTISESSGAVNDDGILCTGDQFCLTATAGYAGYDWNNSETGNPMCSTTPGDYFVVVQDDFGCTATSKTVSITNTPEVEAGTCNVVHDYCQFDQGQVRIQVNNGTPPFQVNWSPSIDGNNSGIISNTGEFIDVNNIPGGTTLNFSIEDNFGCTTN